MISQTTGVDMMARKPLMAKLALTEAERQAAYMLRYKAYSHAGYLQIADKTSFSDIYDADTSSQTVLIYCDGHPIGTVRLCVADPAAPRWETLPATVMFGAEIDEMRAAYRRRDCPLRPAEITRLARDPTQPMSAQISFALFRMVGYLVLAAKADIVFVAVKPNHQPFYQRMGYRMICPAKAYSGLDVQTSLMACDGENFAAVQRQVGFLSDITTADRTMSDLFAGLEVDALPSAPADPIPLRRPPTSSQAP